MRNSYKCLALLLLLCLPKRIIIIMSFVFQCATIYYWKSVEVWLKARTFPIPTHTITTARGQSKPRQEATYPFPFLTFSLKVPWTARWTTWRYVAILCFSYLDILINNDIRKILRSISNTKRHEFRPEIPSLKFWLWKITILI